MVGSGVQSPYTIPGRKAGELGRESLAQRTGNREWGGGSVVNETYLVGEPRVVTVHQGSMDPRQHGCPSEAGNGETKGHRDKEREIQMRMQGTDKEISR